MKLSWLSDIFELIVFNIIILVCVLSLHELGHVFMALLVGCNGKAVIFDSQSDGPYAEIACLNTKDVRLLSGGSFFLTFSLGLTLLLTRNRFWKSAFFLVVGFSILLGAIDLVEITGISWTKTFAILFSLVWIIVGEAKLSILYLIRSKEEFFL
jgi:hypothetical protein